MATFHEFLLSRFELGGFSTEDTLASFLPLARQVAQLHTAGKVAPLVGVALLQVEGVQLWFPESSSLPPRANGARVRQLDREVGGVEILSQSKRTIDVDDGPERSANLLIGARDQEVTQPVYLPGYVCWEQQVGHHDPLSDVFCLGMILASLACGLDFNQPEDLEAFVANRQNLFGIRPQLHPVLAKAIVRMTELSRHRRPQDLSTLIDNLANYRDQNVDFAFDLASTEAQAAAGPRRQVILGKLQERLFELSRRNRLLHFRPTMHTVNLTHASVPLSFDVRSIRPEQILAWKGEFARAISAAEPVSLNRYLNFSEQLFLPSVLDHIRADARRDAAEFGFEQLRLALVFLRWANVKADPPETYDSPLVLLPVSLVKKKGIRDTYLVQPLSSEAEINPVVRHLFKQVYDLDLPATIDLAETTLDAFYDRLAAQITASDPGVTLNKIDRPRIDLIHDLARRRLDRYRRNARLAGAGVRSFMQVDYSYDPANFHPLGLALFRARIRPSATHLREIIQENPTPRNFMVEPEAPVAEKSRQFYALRAEGDGNPYTWDFDLCRLTLGNFKYRKMTLVRDYAELLADGLESPAFDAIFSLAPRTVEHEAPPAPPLEDRCHILPCDPTQTTAIALARDGADYIIQGPPGTGKSQTITNLIADYVMQGKRVLFVCEKRAAIDVVFARLRQQGLQHLCCLIHDSQSDKKEFILELKATYEGLLAETRTKPKSWQRRRANLVKMLIQELEPLQEFNQAMLAPASEADLPVRELLERAIELHEAAPGLSPAELESLPDYAEWLAHRQTIEQVTAAVADIQPDGILAHHPLRLLSPRVVDHERPTQRVEAAVRQSLRLLDELAAKLASGALRTTGPRSLKDVETLVQYAAAVEPLAAAGLVALLDPGSPLSQRMAEGLKQLEVSQAALAHARQATTHWIEKLPPQEVRPALEQAQALEGRLLAFLNPAWWRLRKALGKRYRFADHVMRPRWSQVLMALEAEYQAEDALAAAEAALCRILAVDRPLQTVQQQVQLGRRAAQGVAGGLQTLHQAVLRSEQPRQLVEPLLGMRQVAQELREACAAVLDDFEERPLDGLRKDLWTVEQSLDALGDFLFCLGRLARLPQRLAHAFRTMELDAAGLEAAMAHAAVARLFRANRTLHHFTGAVRDAQVDRLARLSRKWQEVNAASVLEMARQRFLEHVHVASLPAASLTEEQKEFKAAFRRGRRELEHEFGKVMRHKSIRDLATGDTGLVLEDLKPIWLMSPLSVSDTLPLKTDAFDVVIFDEASQITLEEAVPSVFRARQAIVVGDEMQLPPTDFFSAKGQDEDEDGLLLSENGQTFEYDLSSNSFLAHAARNLPSRMLGWHYRSRSESLISFSNWAFYQGRLLTVPEEQVTVSTHEEIVAADPGDGKDNVARLLDRPVSFHYLSGGLYDNRRNRAEADYIAHLVRGLLLGGCGYSIGIVAFSEAQQNEITSALSRLAAEDAAFAERLEEETEREVDGQFVGLLVKNLENIQGDERDVMILSVCYGYAPDGKMRMNFGPINQSGGEKRLNVAFSRAKHHMAVVSSIHHSDITNDYNDGANCLKSYLRYAAACSVGDVAASQRILRELAVWRDLQEVHEPPPSPVVEQVAAALRERGYAVATGVGMSHFRCDVAARRHGDPHYRLGILVDTATHYQQEDLLERDMMRPQLLQAFGWRITHVLSCDWYRDRAAVLEHLVQAVEQDEEPPQVEPEEDDTEDAWAEFDGPDEPEPDAEATPEGQPPPHSEMPPGDGAPQRPAAPVPLVIQPFARYFEFVGGNSAKFWEVALDDRTVTVRFGRIGARGQTQKKVFADNVTAAHTARKLIRQKLGKGYSEKPVPNKE